jgi:hypothetical protein
MKGGSDDWDRNLRKRPSAIEVAKLHSSHGIATCRERWPHVCARSLMCSRGRVASNSNGGNQEH